LRTPKKGLLGKFPSAELDAKEYTQGLNTQKVAPVKGFPPPKILRKPRQIPGDAPRGRTPGQVVLGPHNLKKKNFPGVVPKN